MSLRARLIIAFLFLSVLPLTAVTLLSYASSVNAFERAAEREATDSAADVSRRMDIITADVGERVDRIFVNAAHPDESGVRENLAPALGDTASFIDRVEFHPEAPALPPVPPAPSAGERAPVSPA
ncbi:MAG: hypothetical protein H0W08_05230, partial [Acidobacteria bacterium]|nr:hypothetical protein [Acidobacteriota bacterium]